MRKVLRMRYDETCVKKILDDFWASDEQRALATELFASASREASNIHFAQRIRATLPYVAMVIHKDGTVTYEPHCVEYRT